MIIYIGRYFGDALGEVPVGTRDISPDLGINDILRRVRYISLTIFLSFTVITYPFSSSSIVTHELSVHCDRVVPLA